MSDIKFSNSVSIASILDVIDACGNLPASAKLKYRALGLCHSRNKSPLTRIPENTFIELWSLIGTFHPCAEIGLVIGQKISPESKGVLASWVSQSDTIGEALTLFQKNIILMNPSEHWEIDDDGTYCTLSLTIHSEYNYPNQAIERSFSAMVAWARMLSAHPFSIKSAHFTCEKPDYADKYESIFGSNIQFGSQTNQLVFNSSFLTYPITSSSRYVKEIMAENADKVLRALNDTGSIKTLVSEIVTSNMSEGHLIGIDEIATKLYTSRQTLYRKLEKENTTFRSIVDEVRKKYIIINLNKPNAPSITELSYNLGFKDTSSFYKAFKRYFNATPKEYIESRRIE
ncbi:AraC family transcriptional regulator ligand-binding domain-containing protein [Vibrio sp. RC27]